MKPRVCMLIYNYRPGPEGGTERQCRKLAPALARRGAACTVLTALPACGAPENGTEDGVPIVRLPTFDGVRRESAARPPAAEAPRGGSPQRPRLPPGRVSAAASAVVAWLNALRFQASAARHFARHADDYDLIHVHTSEWIAGLAVRLGRRHGLPVLCKVATLPALPEIRRTVPFRRRWDRERRLAAFIALNEAMAGELRAAGVPPAAVHVIPNSTELPDLSARREDPGRVLYVGNLTQHAYKAFDVLFDAWVLVHRARPAARLSVAGGGDRAPWENRLEAAGCRASVSFEGFVEAPGVLYARAAVLALPSRQEGMSNALLEAQSWGVPAVVSDIAANRAVVEDGVNGLVVPAGDAAALAAGLVRMLDNSELRRSLGRGARSRMEAGYSVDAVADRTLAVYDRMMRGAAGVRAGEGGS